MHRTSREVELRAELVLKESLVWVPEVLRKVAEERERRRAGRELGDVLDLDVLALPCWWWIVLDLRKHLLVDLGCRDLARVVLVNMSSCVEHIHDSLLVDHRCEDDREVIERSEAFLDGNGVLLHGVAVFLDSVPLVDNDHAAFLVALDQVKDSHVLCLDACLRIYHEDTYVRVLDGADRTHD